MKTKRIFTNLFMVLALVLTNVGSVFAEETPPADPSSFWGTVTLDGASVPAGTIVSAHIGGQEKASVETIMVGDDAYYSISVPGVEGETEVIFYVGGYLAADPGTWVAKQNTHLDLVATTNIDTTPPVLTITGATADGEAMDGDLETGYILEIKNIPSVDHLIQFAAGTATDEPLATEYFGLYLTDSTVDATALKTYYANRGTPEPYLTYLQDAADGVNPFVFIDGETVSLVDAAKHDLAFIDVPMTIPDDYPLGTYTVEGVITDLAGNDTPVTLIIIISPSTDTFTLEYFSGAGGTLTGDVSQVVVFGSDGTEVTAVPDSGYYFMDWSDGVTTAARTDTNIIADLNVTANFEMNMPWVSTYPEWDQVEGHNWPLGVSVTLTINGTDYSDTQTVIAAPWNPTEETYVEFNLGGIYDIQPGDEIVLTDGVTPKDHIVTNVAITGVDETLDTVTGTADFGAEIGVNICDDSGCYAFRFVTADGSGNWTAEFSVPGPGPMEGEIYDIQTGIHVSAWQNDDDFDDTTVSWDTPMPSFSARFPDGEVHGYEWPLGVDVTISIDDLDNGAGEDYSDIRTVDWAEWDPSMTGVVFPLDGFTLEPGQIITMTDGVTVKEHTVTDVTITAADPSLDTVNGTAAAGTDVYVDLCNDSGCDFRDVTADGSGNWIATFTDIVAGDNLSAMQHDDDGDHTAFEWRVPSPWLEAYPLYDMVAGFDWPDGSTVNLTINTTDYAASGVVGIPSWDPNQTYVEFNLSGAFDLQAGDVVELSGSGTTKTHTITDLTVTSIDAGLNTVSGTTTAPFGVAVWAHADWEGSHKTVTPVANAWIADLSPYDLAPGEDGAAVQSDDDGDTTWIDWRVPNPVFDAHPIDDRIEGYDWPVGTTINLTINIVEHTASGVVGVSSWDPNQTYVEFDLSGVFDLQAGDVVELSGSGTTKTHTITDLTVTSVDVDTNIVSGTTTAPFAVDVWAHVDGEGSHKIVTPVANAWIADLSPYDLALGEDGAAVQSDDDGDTTWIDWAAPYSLTLNIVGNGSITPVPAGLSHLPGTDVELTAAADPGWTFTGWSDDLGGVANPETITMDGNKTVTATFTIDSFTLTYFAGVGGTLIGDTAQVVDYGMDGSVVIAVPLDGYHFVDWSDGVATAARTDTNVMADLSVTANFAADTFTLTYAAGTGGILTGDSPQTINYGEDGTEVTAVPDAGYHFVDWSDGITTAARTDVNVMADLSVTANFASDTFTLTYAAGTGGTLTGDSPQTINYGEDGTEVIAVPDTGYDFVDWSDGVSSAARTDTNITTDLSVTANFADSSSPVLTITGATADNEAMDGDLGTGYILETTNLPTVDHLIQFAAGTTTDEPLAAEYFGLYLTDSTVDPAVLKTYYADRGTPEPYLAYLQDAADGVNPFVYIDGTTVLLVDAAKHDIAAIDVPMTIPDDYPLGTYTVEGVITDLAGNDTPVTLIIVITPSTDTFTLTYAAGTGGTLTGDSPQTITYGEDGIEVTAVPDIGYHFVDWSDGITTAARTDTNVMADLSVTANFASDTFTLTYAAGTGGTLTGDSPQTITYGEDGTEVTAVPDTGYHFVDWSDGITTAARTDTNVMADLSVTAEFAENPVVSTWYLAEGYTGAGFGTYILVQNPNDVPTQVDITYMLQDGSLITRDVIVPANARETIVTQDAGQVGPDQAFSTKLEADQPIIVERAMYWPNGDGTLGGHDTTGVQQPETDWYLAEGYTGSGFNTFILIQNPNDVATDVEITYMVQNGSNVARTITVPANSRYTILTNDVAQVGSDQAFSTKLVADQPIIVERAMYFNNDGHAAGGVTSPITTWYLSEGYTGSGYETFILLQNSNDTETDVAITYMLEDGSQISRTVTVPANARYTVVTQDAAQVGLDQAFSTVLVADLPIIVERAMYWPNGDSAVGGHATTGVRQTASDWYLAEGYTGGGFNTFILIQNPNSSATDVDVTYMVQGGSNVIRTVTIPANSRFTILANDIAQVGPDQAFSTKLVAATQSIIVERAMYFGNGGHVAAGVVLAP